MRFSLTRVFSNELESGMILGENIINDLDDVLISEGIELNEKTINKIISMGLEKVVIKIILEETYLPQEDEQNDFQNKQVKKLTIENLYKIEIDEKEVVETRTIALGIIKDTLINVSTRGSLDVERLSAIVTLIIDQIFENEDIVSCLHRLKGVDDYAFEHSLNVTVQSLITGIYLGFNKSRLAKLGIGAILHDLGKMLIDNNILNKPGKLSEEEFVIMKKHSELGYKVASKFSTIDKDSLDGILFHHERIDGKGYPLGLDGDSLSLYPKIIAIADVYDALTSDRVYSKKVPNKVAIRYVLDSINTHFDYEVSKKFVLAMAVYPIGLKVKLSTGDFGIVIKHNRDKPVVKVLIDSSGNGVQGYYEIDLGMNPSVFITDINPSTSFDETVVNISERTN